MSAITKDERRTRRRALKASAAAVHEGKLLLKCRIVDFSEAGARLHVREHPLPDRFQLIDIPAAVTYSVRVVWRRGPSIGVAFLHARPVEDEGTPEWVAEMWRDLRAEMEDGAHPAAA